MKKVEKGKGKGESDKWEEKHTLELVVGIWTVRSGVERQASSTIDWKLISIEEDKMEVKNVS